MTWSRPSSSSFKLPVGGTLGFAEYGSPDGRPLLYFHGHPGSRFEAGFLAEAAAHLKVRLIGIDRPGMGLSSYQPHRRILDWPQDVAALADHLGLDRFAVVGFSGGGPYALACAYAIPERVSACGVVSGVSPSNMVTALLASWLPWVLLPFVRWRSFSDEEQARRALRRLAVKWPDPDKGLLHGATAMDVMAASLVEAFAQGSRGAAKDESLLGAAWGFAPEQVRGAPVYFWHGLLDEQVKPAKALELATRVPGAHVEVASDGAHISCIAVGAEKVIQMLVGRRAGSS